MIQLLVVGDWQRDEMRPIRDWIGSRGSLATVRPLLQLPASGSVDPPDLVIVCQSWPDEFSPSEVSNALGRWPLAQWVVCYGAWCESDGRTRSIWPISVRVPVSEAIRRLDRVWRIVTQRDGEPLPLTASRDETFAFDHASKKVDFDKASRDRLSDTC